MGIDIKDRIVSSAMAVKDGAREIREVGGAHNKTVSDVRIL